MTARDVIAGALVTGSNDVWSIADRVLRELEFAGFTVVPKERLDGVDESYAQQHFGAPKTAAKETT